MNSPDLTGARPAASAHGATDIRAAAFEAARDAVLIVDADGRVVYSNPAARALHGIEEDGEIAIHVAPGLETFLGEATAERVHERIRPRVRRWGWWRGEMEGLTADGRSLSLEASVTAMTDDALVFVLRDVSGRGLREEALRSREQLFRLLAQNSTDVIGLHEPGGRWLYISPSIERILGYDPYELLGTPPGNIVHPSHRERVRQAFAHAADGEETRVSYRVRTRKDQFIWFETLVRVVDRVGSPHLQSSSRDISERKRFERQLSFRALHDPLTSLPNRALFITQLEQALTLAQREGTRVGVVFADLDEFKRINDTRGHAAGDTALVRTAERLVAVVREADTVARLGGDEFAILLHRVDDGDNAAALVERIRAAFPLEIRPDLAVRMSVGLAISPPGGEPVERLLARADESMYAEKGAASRSAAADGPHVATRTGGGTPAAELATALSSGQGLALRYQPIVSLRTREVTGVEAFLRWTTSEGRIVAPREVVRIARSAGLGSELTRWVAEEACRRMRVWGGHGLSPSHVCINASEEEIGDSGFAETIADAIEAAGIAPSELSIEIAVDALASREGPLRELAASGVRIVVEGLESLGPSGEPLRRSPASRVKVDRSLVRRLPSPEGRAAARSLIRRSEDLGCEVGAVGVERPAQVEELARLGFATGQGFLLGRPQGALFLEAFLARGGPALDGDDQERSSPVSRVANSSIAASSRTYPQRE